MGHRSLQGRIGDLLRAGERGARHRLRRLAVEHRQLGVAGHGRRGRRLGRGQRHVGQVLDDLRRRPRIAADEGVQLGARRVALAGDRGRLVLGLVEVQFRLHDLQARHGSRFMALARHVPRAPGDALEIEGDGEPGLGRGQPVVRAPDLGAHLGQRARQLGLARAHHRLGKGDAPAALAAQLDGLAGRE